MAEEEGVVVVEEVEAVEEGVERMVLMLTVKERHYTFVRYLRDKCNTIFTNQKNSIRLVRLK